MNDDKEENASEDEDIIDLNGLDDAMLEISMSPT